MPTEQIVTRYIVDELLPGGGTTFASNEDRDEVLRRLEGK